MGTAWRTLAKPSAGGAPTRLDGESSRTRSGKRSSMARLRRRKLIVVGIGNRRRIFGVIAAVVPGDLFGQARELGRSLLLGQLLDGFGGKRHRSWPHA